MYKKSAQSTLPTLFEGYTQHLSGSRLAKLEDPTGWQNYFYKEITSRINEDLFLPLYHHELGRVNASVRILISMMILKDGNDWTDEQLFSECDFNILVQRALGLTNFGDEIPSPATFYNFKLALLIYELDSGINLLDALFESLTKDQIIRYKVSGKKIRMDSKLLHSNVAKTTRLQMSLGVIRKFYNSLSEVEKALIDYKDSELLSGILEKKPEQYTYGLAKDTAAEQLIKVGQLTFYLYSLFDGMQGSEYKILGRLLKEHFDVTESENDPSQDITPKNMKDQGGTPLQTAHDPQATYRNKKGSKKQIITGYVSNITETCKEVTKEDDKPLNLITNVQTTPASTSDDKFFPSAVSRTQAILNDKIEVTITDGGYNSASNEELSRLPESAFKFYTTAIQGPKSNYDYELQEDGNYKVTNQTTGKEQIATLHEKNGTYRIKAEGKSYMYRYIPKKTIINYFRRKQMEAYPDWVYGLRANSESTIHQVFCKLNGPKTKYRGLFQHQTYVLNRAIWTNFRRINKYKRDFNKKTTKCQFFALTAMVKAVDIILNITNKLLRNRQTLFGLFVNPDLRRGF